MRGKFISGYLIDDKQMPAWIIFLMFIAMFRLCLTLSVGDMDLSIKRQNRVIIKVNSTDKHAFFTQLKTYGFINLYQITPSTFIFDYNHENRTLQESLQNIKNKFTNQLLAIESVRIYENIIQPWDRGKETYNQVFVDSKSWDSNLKGGHDTSIGHVWSRGYSGKGVTVAVTDVGIDSQLLDLQKNMNLDMSFNFVYNKSDITPAVIDRDQSKALLLTDQGNNLAGVIAGEKDNGICGDGIAYNSNIVGIKIFAIKINQLSSVPSPTLITASDVIARALTHRLDEIDVYVNAWIPTSSFDQLDLATREAIHYGASMGRRGLGAIYIVPAGSTGNKLSNSIYTIAVGMIDVKSTNQRISLSDASVLTSGLISSNVVTVSHNNKCLANFEGYSAAVAQISAIIALGLEANPHLSLREVQHLLVEASDYNQLQTDISLKRNAAGHYFNENFGFGVLSAEKFINLTKTVKVNPLIVKSVRRTVTTRIDSLSKKKMIVEYCYSCDVINDIDCLTTIEHVSIALKTDAPLNGITVELVSPSRTSSLLMDNQNIVNQVKGAQLISTHFWNEFAFGTWILTVESHTNSAFGVKVKSLTLYGTRNLTKIFGANHLPRKQICENTKTETEALTRNMTTASSMDSDNDDDDDDDDDDEEEEEEDDDDDDGKLNIPIIVVIPVGVVIMCGILVFICRRGGTQGHASTFGKPMQQQDQPQQEENLLFTRQISQDNKLHRQVSLLRQKSKQSSKSDELAEDIEGEEAAMNGEV